MSLKGRVAGQKVKIQLFQNMVLLHINLNGSVVRLQSDIVRTLDSFLFNLPKF